VWLVALFGTTGAILLAYGFLTAAAVAIVFVGTSVLAVVAFVLYLLLGEEPVALRLLLIALVFVGLAVEIGGLIELFGLIRVR
jgi:hypothetical protein